MLFGDSPLKPGRIIRAGIATATLGAALFTATGTAFADDEPADMPSRADRVTAIPSAPADVHIWSNEGRQIRVGLISLDFGNSQTSPAYCIDIDHGLQNRRYIETRWDQSNVGDGLPQIQFILQNSHPQVAARQVLERVGAPSTGNERTDAHIVYAGSQAAIWHFSDSFELGEFQPGEGNSFDAAAYDSVQRVFEFFTDPENNTGAEEPPPALEITPSTAEGSADGSPVGPFTVRTTAEVIELSLEGNGSIVNETGEELTQVGDGEPFWVVSDQPGEVTVRAEGTGSTPSGRVFVKVNDPDGAQKVILAKSVEVEVAAMIRVTFRPVASPTPSPSESASPSPTPSTIETPSAAPSPSAEAPAPMPTPTPSAQPAPQRPPPLANTGASPLPYVLGGAVLLGAGAGLMVITRRRKNRSALH